MSHTDSPLRYPFLHELRPTRQVDEPPKYIFLVMVESFSSATFDKTNESGRAITPFMNQLVKQSLYFEEFYANSMQTERGHSATICSLIPSYRTKIMSTYIENEFRCLPEILGENGYTTTFIQAPPKLTFDNSGNFMRRIGFHHVLAMDEAFVSPQEQQYYWGSGLQDDKFYEKTLQYLNRMASADSNAKFFTMMATISNHQGFDEMPDEQKYLYPTPKTFNESFLYSMYLTDHYLKTLFAELDRCGLREESLILILGDHGFPTGVRQSVSNEMPYYNELFKVPLVVSWGQKIEPTRMRDLAFLRLILRQVFWNGWG